MLHRERLIAAALAALVVVLFLGSNGGIPGARGESSERAAMTEGSPSVIHSGPAGRIALSGPWTLRGDKEFNGSLKGWQAGTFAGSVVDLPFSPNAKRVVGTTGIESFRGSAGWYRTAFSVPRDGEYALRFESVNHRADVWVDGKLVASHTGEYLPFETDLVLDAAREHTLVVRADWRGPAAMKRAGWHRTWFNFGGINREVTLRPIGASKIQAPTVTTRLQPDGSALVDLSVLVRNRSAESRPIKPTGTLRRDGQEIAIPFPEQTVGAGTDRRFEATVKVDRPALWAPGSPNLYDLDLAVPNEAAFTLRTGLRQIEVRGTRLLLNGQPLLLKGASIHEDAKGRGDAVTGADMDEIVDGLKAIGANATRAQHPLNPAMLERLDAAGILVWVGIGPVDAPGAWTSKTPKLRRQAEERVRATLRQAQFHPSILAWNLANEVAGNGHSGGQASYIDKMARELKARDPGRPVALDVWGAHPPSKMGPMYDAIDLIGDTNYIGWYEKTLAGHAAVRKAIRQHVAKFRRVFKGKALVVTEFGAEANELNAPGRPGSYDFQSGFLRDHIETYKSIPSLSGMLVWNLRDFAVSPAFAGGSIRKNVPDIKLVRGINQKGLFTYDGRPKPSVEVVRDLFAQP